MKRGLIFGTDSTGWAAALNVIILTDCWQVVHYPRCTEDKVKSHTDRKCNWEAGGHWEGWHEKKKNTLGCDCCSRRSSLLCCDATLFNSAVSDWRTRFTDLKNEGEYAKTFDSQWTRQSLWSALSYSWRDASKVRGSHLPLTNALHFIKPLEKCKPGLQWSEYTNIFLLAWGFMERCIKTKHHAIH